VIRHMLPRDLDAVCAVDRLCFPTPWRTETFTRQLEGDFGYYRIAERDGRVVGYIGSEMVEDEAYITTLGVHPDLRAQGIGERLLADVLAEAVRRGVRRITLEVREGNAAARRLYGKYGFSPVSRRRAYYRDNDEDAIVMWIEDASRPGFRRLLQERLEGLRRRSPAAESAGP